jgi:hypothetical protein
LKALASRGGEISRWFLDSFAARRYNLAASEGRTEAGLSNPA